MSLLLPLRSIYNQLTAVKWQILVFFSIFFMLKPSFASSFLGARCVDFFKPSHMPSMLESSSVLVAQGVFRAELSGGDIQYYDFQAGQGAQSIRRQVNVNTGESLIVKKYPNSSARFNDIMGLDVLKDVVQSSNAGLFSIPDYIPENNRSFNLLIEDIRGETLMGLLRHVSTENFDSIFGHYLEILNTIETGLKKMHQLGVLANGKSFELVQIDRMVIFGQPAVFARTRVDDQSVLIIIHTKNIVVTPNFRFYIIDPS